MKMLVRFVLATFFMTSLAMAADCIPFNGGYGCAEADYYLDCLSCTANCVGGSCDYNGKGSQLTCSGCP